MKVSIIGLGLLGLQSRLRLQIQVLFTKLSCSTAMVCVRVLPPKTWGMLRLFHTI